MAHSKMKELKSVSNDALLRRLRAMLPESRRIESDVVSHVGEVDARRLFAEEASPSMFRYCTDVLHMSEAESYLRINVARSARKHPVLLTMLVDGRLHLSGIAELAPHLDSLEPAARTSVLERATHKTKREIKQLVAELAPKPDVPPIIRKLPKRKPKQGRKPEPAARSSTTEVLRPDGVDRPRDKQSDAPRTEPQPRPAAEAPDPPSSQRPVVEPLAPARYKVMFTASSELRHKLDRLAALMPGTDLATMIDVAVTEKLERLEAKRFGKTTKPRPRNNRKKAQAVRNSGYVTAEVRRKVCERDGYQCTFVSKNGRRCPARDKLEFHHHKPRGRGGSGEADNISLRCRAHNLYAAEQDYGEEKMRQYRRRCPDRVSEPAPRLLRPDGVRVARIAP
jgi:5-methylcytosine-specific restriction endonuclease McrA